MIPIKDQGFLSFLQTKKFRAALRNETGKADRQGSYLDPSARAVLDKTALNIRDQYPIADLTGLEHFIHVESLTINLYSLKKFPKLPPQLKTLHLKRLGKIKTIPVLPDSLKKLSIDWSVDFIALPNNLTHFNCFNASLSQLPVLPASLEELHCSHNKLKNLPALPDGLSVLDCSYNQLQVLPTLPVNLKTLTCSDNRLVNLPPLPKALITLDCSDNKITTIGTIPHTIKSFISCHNQLASIPVVPQGAFINVEGNRTPTIHSYFGGKKTDNFNLKLAVIDALSLQDKAFEKKLLEAFDKGSIMSYVTQLVLSQEQLDSITTLSIDGGNRIYTLLNPQWDGEEETYEITSINGIDELHYLTNVEVIAMVDSLVEEALYQQQLLD